MELRKMMIFLIAAVLIMIAAILIQRGRSVSLKAPEQEVHYLAFASDRHGKKKAIRSAFSGMPFAEGRSVEYVCLVGDMGKGKIKQAISFDSSEVYKEVLKAGFSKVESKNDVSILWATHDAAVNDDAGIVFGDKGIGSGLMKEGLNSDGSPAYYIYGIAFYEMKEADRAAEAAEAFRDWIDKLKDDTAPVIVLCHMPLHHGRKGNNGAALWNDALNYAATGKAAAGPDETVIKDIIFMYGHNHRYEYSKEDPDHPYSGEFYIPCGAAMKIGAGENGFSRIYYTYTTAGYLKDDPAATLVAIDDKNITIEKYHGGRVDDGLYDPESRLSGAFATEFLREGKHVISRATEEH